VYPQGRPPPSEQRQRSLFGSPLPPLYHHHSGKGRTTSERRDGGPDDTPKYTDSSSRPHPKPGLASQAGLLCASRAAYTPRSGAGAPIGRAPVSEQRQRSLFGSPLPPLYHHHSGKGRTTSERRDGGPDDTPKCTDSSSRSPSPPTPKAPLGFSSRAALCSLSGLHSTERSRCTHREGTPPSEQRQRSLFGSPLPPLYHHHSGKGRTTSERRDGGPDATTTCTGIKLLTLPSRPQTTIKAGLDRQARLLLLFK